MAAALLSRCLYRSFRTSLSFLMVFLFGCRSMAWKFTGSPYLEKNKYQPLNNLQVSQWAHVCTVKRLHLKTDSTKTRRALIWTQAMKASLKFTLSHRTSGPCMALSDLELAWKDRTHQKQNSNMLKTGNKIEYAQIGGCAVLSFDHRRTANLGKSWHQENRRLFGAAFLLTFKVTFQGHHPSCHVCTSSLVWALNCSIVSRHKPIS